MYSTRIGSDCLTKTSKVVSILFEITVLYKLAGEIKTFDSRVAARMGANEIKMFFLASYLCTPIK